MADSTLLIENERCKAWSTNLTRLGSGLLAYVAAQVYLDPSVGWDRVAIPFVIGCALSWAGWKFLGLLQEAD